MPHWPRFLQDLATLYVSQGEYAQAESLYKRLLAITENAFGADHPEVARSLKNLRQYFYRQNRPGCSKKPR